jgi:predicted ABC-type sugar transport system permease subunit
VLSAGGQHPDGREVSDDVAPEGFDGVFRASTTGGAHLDLGAGASLLFAVAAAVIGGTSLFGGRGRPVAAIIGALVIMMIPNGIGLRPSLPASYGPSSRAPSC